MAKKPSKQSKKDKASGSDELVEMMLQERADLAQLVGSCIFAWSEVETQLTALFGYAVGAKEEISYAVMESVNSFQVRLDMTDAALQITIRNKDVLYLWNKMYVRLDKLNKKRHEIAHCQVVTCTNVRTGTTSFEVIPFYKIQIESKKRLRKLDLEERRARFRSMQEALVWMVHAVLSGPDKHPTKNDSVPELVRELLSAADRKHEEI